MFERVISQTIQTITTQTLRERPMVSLVEILEDERIPTRLKPFFETEVRWWLYNEMLARQANKRFEYDHPELSSLLSYLEQVQFRHARFEREDFTTVLDSAVKLTYNYLCRPQTTLKWYIFRGQPVMPLREVMLRFGAFLDYPYFPTVFADWVERKQQERPTFDGISATEFERVIRRIDDQILLNCTVEDLLGIISPIFEFIGEGEQMVVPVDALIIFFDDKNIKRLVDFLEGVRARGQELVSREEFVTLLDELLSTAEDEPEADFSDIYQNDELDDVVRRHLESGDAPVTVVPQHPGIREGEDEETAGAWMEEVVELSQEEPDGGQQDHVMVDDLLDEDSEEAGLAGFINPDDHRLFTEAFGSLGGGQAEEESISDQSEPGDVEAEHDARIEESEPESTPERGAYTAPELQAINSDVEVPPTNAGDEESEELASSGDEEEFEAMAGSDIEEEDSMDETAEEEAVIEEAADGDEEAEVTSTSSADRSESYTADEVDEEIDLHIELREQSRQERTVMQSGDREAAEAGGDAAVATDSAPDDLGDVRTFISPMLERKVIKRVFNRDRDEYETALDRLNDADTWRAASQVLDELFIRYDVDPYSRTAIRFTDSIYGRYLPRN